MADYNEAIKNLQTIQGMPLTIRMAIEALEKQIPKKPRIEFSPAGLVLSYFCPICGKYFGDRTKHYVILFHTPRYCECGHALDWGDE